MRDRRVGAVLAARLDLPATTPAEVIAGEPDVTPPGRTAIDGLRMMQGGGYRHVPVVDGKKTVGIVSRGDFRGLEQARLDGDPGPWERA
jgi:CBS domain-containing protein